MSNAFMDNVTLAKTFDPSVDLNDYLVSEKLDGVRALWTGEKLISRSGREFDVPKAWSSQLPKIPLDGELWMGRGRFDETSGLVRRIALQTDTWATIEYHVFDAPGEEGSFEERLAYLRYLQRGLEDSTPIRIVEQRAIGTHEELMARLQADVEAGAEGLMLRSRHAPYRVGRSTDLLKLKPRHDAEATVIGHTAGKGKHAGRLGALRLQTSKGIRFTLGVGFTDTERESPPAIGSQVTFSFQSMTPKGKPRFARYERPYTPL